MRPLLPSAAMEHVSADLLHRFAAGQASAAESREVVAHLLRGCDRCAAAVNQALCPSRVPSGTYDRMLGRMLSDRDAW